ncbi:MULTISPECIES: hypothetical protein [Thalassotalea]|nr:MULTISPECIES: hypothetical protein [Thalassotalea]GHF01285.1 hemolysin D [Thalassotalea profundi]
MHLPLKVIDVLTMLNLIFSWKFVTTTLSTTVNTALLIVLSLLLSVHNVKANENIPTVSLSSLGDFQTEFTTIEPANFLNGQSLTGKVTFRTGENYSVSLPFGIQKISYLVKNGSTVGRGEKIAKIEGYEVHHFLDEYESVKAIFSASELHYLTNKRHFNDKTLKSSEWLAISQSYFDAKLQLEHFNHQLSFLTVDENENVYFISPENGIVSLKNVENSKSVNDLAFEIINPESVKVEILIPISQQQNLSHFVVSSNCQLVIKNVEMLANKYHSRVWASPATNNCNFRLGQTLTVSPVYHFAGYKVPSSSIFEFENRDFIAVKIVDKLRFYPLTIASTDQENTYIITNEDISNKEVLASSVSIVQGILLKLGAE